MPTNQIELAIFPDSHEAEACGYNYGEWDVRPTPLNIVKGVIVKKGTQHGNATVDFILEDAAGNKYTTMITARLLEQIVKYSK